MNSADEAFYELVRNEMEIFNKLMGKKVKIDSRITLESIINFLKSMGMHTAYLERQKEVHSIFFISENETSFLPIKGISDREFNESSLEEMSTDEFINILNTDEANIENNIVEQPDVDSKGLDSLLDEKDDLSLDNLSKIKKPPFLNWDNGEAQAVMNIDRIVYASYRGGSVYIHMTDGYIVTINNADAESYKKFCKILKS